MEAEAVAVDVMEGNDVALRVIPAESERVTLLRQMSDVRMKVRAFRREALALTVTTDDEYTRGMTLSRDIRASLAEWEGLRKRMKAPVDELSRQVQDVFKPMASDGEVAVDHVNKECGGYAAAKQKAARELQEKLDREAKKKQDDLNRKAEVADKLGLPVKAEELRDRAASVPPAPVVQAEAPRVSGMVMVEEFYCSIDQPDAVPREYCIPDETQIKRIVKASKGKVVIPGVRVWSAKVPRRVGGARSGSGVME